MADVLWRDTAGNTAIWFMNGAEPSSSAGLGQVPPIWSVVGTSDFNGDGLGNLLWRDSSSDLSVWLMSGATVISQLDGGRHRQLQRGWDDGCVDRISRQHPDGMAGRRHRHFNGDAFSRHDRQHRDGGS
jgi:hypothetical protein